MFQSTALLMNQLVERRLGVAMWKADRLTQLLLLAVSVVVYNIMAMAVANSLFLSNAGANKLPIAFILIGLFSVPAYGLFSQVVDRYVRPRLFRYVLLISIAVAVGMRVLLTLDTPPVYFAILIAVFFQWDLYNNILFPSLLTDYFSTLEYKRYAPFIGIAQAVGALLGGSLTALLSGVLATPNLLLCLPFLYAVTIAQLVYLEHSQRRLDTVKPQGHVGLMEALKTFPDLVKRHRLILFLAGSSFLLVIIYLMSEFLWFNIYAQQFKGDRLTGFLGLIRIANSVVQVAVLYCFTRPLLQWLGVARMNVVYPITTLASYLGLALNLNLRSAVILNVNGDSLYKSINLPVHQLNYNAIPREFMGRVRALSDGLIYAVGLTLAGCVLWIANTFLSLVQITWIGIGLVGILLLLRLPMGRLYTQGLEAMIRSDAINLDELNEHLTQLPPQSSTVLRELLREGDRYTQIKGLELAANLGHPGRFLSDVQPLLPKADAEIRRAVVKLFSTNPDSESIQYFEGLLEADDPALQTVAIEILIADRYAFNEQQIRRLLGNEQQEIQALAALAAVQTGATDDPQIEAACEQIWQSDLDNTTAKTIVRAVAYSGNRELAPLLQSVIAQGSPEVKWEGLEALAGLARPGNLDLAEIAAAELEHPEPLVRASAFKLLGAARGSGMLRYVAPGLGDPDPRVRQRAAEALAAYGEQGLPLAQDSLASPNPEVVTTAIAATGQVRTKQASDILFEYLAPDFQQVAQTRRWQQQIPQNDASWQALRVAIADYHQRLIQKVLYVLSCLGHSRTVNTVNRILNTTDSKDFANAVEVLASLNHRRFVLPLLPVLEQLGQQEQPGPRIRGSSKWLRTKGYKLLLAALESRDRWIRIGALIAFTVVPSALMRDPDPLVKTVAKQIFLPPDQHPSPSSSVMNRLLLLKNVALLKNLSLDELLLIDKVLEQEQVLAGETIFAEGSWGTHLYIIAEGNVRITKAMDGEQRELKQLSLGNYFGEVALFDNAPRWYGAIAINDCILLKLEKDRFISLVTQRPHIILEICRFLSQQLREMDRYRIVKPLPPMPQEEVEVTNS